jgi:hypothetical protein
MHGKGTQGDPRNDPRAGMRNATSFAEKDSAAAGSASWKSSTLSGQMDGSNPFKLEDVAGEDVEGPIFEERKRHMITVLAGITFIPR